MGFFDRFSSFVNKLGVREPSQAPDVEPAIAEAFDVTAKRESLFDRARKAIRNVFRPRRDETPKVDFETVVNVTERVDVNPFRQELTQTEIADRKRRIFEFRRSVEDEGHLFYRLTQWIWDRPDIAAKDRDAAIVSYYRDKEGLSDLNEIYDFVLSENAELVERYRNARTPGEKYDILANIKIRAANA